MGKFDGDVVETEGAFDTEIVSRGVIDKVFFI